MLTTATLFDALERRRAQLGLSQAEVGRRAFGRSDSSALQNIKRGSSPTWENLISLCSALGLVVRIDPKEGILSGFSETREGDDLSEVNALRTGFLPIPWHNLANRKGSAPVALQSSWLASEGFTPDHLTAIIPDELQLAAAEAGQSVAILDATAPQRGVSGLWCYTFDRRITIGQIAFADEIVVTFPSDFSQGKARVVQRADAKGFAVLGRVVWLGLIPKP